MSPRAAAAAVARSAAGTIHAPTRTRPALRPAPARRRSGATVARPATRTRARFDGLAVLDRLLRGPAYIAVVGILLAGIVFFNVDVLELNHGIANTDTRTAQLKRENAALTLQLAKLGSSERIQRMALQQGLVLPQPGDVRYLRAGRQDAARALRVMTAPSSSGAAAVVPAVVTQQSTPNAASATPTTTQPTTTATPTTSTTTATPTTTTTPTTTSTPTTSTSTGTTTPTSSTPTSTAQPAANPTTAGAVSAPSTP